MTVANGPIPRYTPPVSSKPVNFSNVSKQMPSSTAIDDFMDAAFDMSSYSTPSADDQLPPLETAVEDNEFNDRKHDVHHRSHISSNASHLHADRRIKIPHHAPHIDDVSVKVMTHSGIRRNDHHNGNRIHTIASGNGRQFVKKSDSRVPSAAAGASHQQQHLHQSGAVSGSQRNSQLTDNLKNNLERLLQRSLNQQSGRRLQSEDRRHRVAASRQVHHSVAGGRRHVDGPNKVVERSSHQSRPMADINDLIDEDIDLQQFTPAYQLDQHRTSSQTRLADRPIGIRKCQSLQRRFVSQNYA